MAPERVELLDLALTDVRAALTWLATDDGADTSAVQLQAFTVSGQ